jgi:hypothetical protein
MAKATEIILAVMQEVQAVGKTGRNINQNYNFRGIDAVINAVGPALRKHGGFIVPNVLERESEIQPTKNGGSINMVRLMISFSIQGTEGDPVTGVVAAEASDTGDKATAKAMSVGLRTFLLQLLALPTDEPDPDTFSYELGQAAAKKTRDWAAELKTVKDAAAARQLYNEARTHQAPAAVMQQIIDLGQSFGQPGK